MLRVVLRLLLATCVIAPAPACSSGAKKTVKKPKKGKKAKDNDTKALVSEARDAAKNGDYDAADQAYAEAYESS